MSNKDLLGTTQTQVDFLKSLNVEALNCRKQLILEYVCLKVFRPFLLKSHVKISSRTTGSLDIAVGLT